MEKFKLVFCDWQKNGKSIYNTEEGIELSLGSFHSGTSFDCNINLNNQENKEIKSNIENGYTPVFYLIKDHENE